MSLRRFTKRKFAAVALACGIMIGLAPAANAGTEYIYQCVPVPVETPGVTVLGRHVPALSHIEVCAGTSVTLTIHAPKVTFYDNCGSVCFDIKAYFLPAEVGTSGATALVRWWEDGIEKYPGPSNPIVNPITLPGAGAGGGAPTEICLIAVGAPTPPCTF